MAEAVRLKTLVPNGDKKLEAKRARKALLDGIRKKKFSELTPIERDTILEELAIRKKLVAPRDDET